MDDEGGDGGEDVFLFHADRAKTGRAGCKKCKQKIEQGALRMAKTGTNPFGSGTIKMWHHVDCMFQVFARQRATTAKIECVDDIGGWDKLSKEDQEEILSRLPESVRAAGKKKPPQPAEEKKKSPTKGGGKKGTGIEDAEGGRDDSLREYRRLLADVANLSAYLDKTARIREFFEKGTDGKSFKGDLGLWIRLLLPGVIKRVYNLQSKQIVKLFSRIFRADLDEMLQSLEQGDVAETIRLFFTTSKRVSPASKSVLTLQEVDTFLDYLSKLTREEDQINHFESILPKCTGNDLKIIIRLIKHDLRINAGAKHILDAVHPDAYEAFQASRDINSILKKLNTSSKGVKSKLNVGISPMVPVLPMLAQPCRSSEEALTKCPNGMYSEIKYDGERVQVHKNGNQFKYYSRSLKPVLPHKVRTFEEYIPQAFPYGEDLILDSEILMIDTITGQPLPFGTLGIHKKGEYQHANVCLFVFDCIYYNGKSLLNEYELCEVCKDSSDNLIVLSTGGRRRLNFTLLLQKRPICSRRKILHEKMKEIKNRIVFSEMKEIHTKQALEEMMTKVFQEGLEGLVLKDLKSTYEPGKRHWLKVKKDYLFGGAMADSADLVVLGAWYGTGQKGGMMSVFLMGCYDEDRKHWCTVTKVHTGHDDATLEKLQTQLDMVKISKDANKVPSWLKCTKTMIPDFVARDPKAQPVWEITGAELTKNVVHTADGISVRFPRVTKIRDDKDWKTANTLAELKEIYKKSKETADFTLSGIKSESTTPPSSPKKSPRKRPPSSPLTKMLESNAKIPKTTQQQTLRRSMSPEEARAPIYTLNNPLPDVFIGVKLYIPDILPPKEKEVLERYFIAMKNQLKAKEKGVSQQVEQR